ncbi:ankyrin repeat-containing domain protein [Aspergillus lucknowensis]|uniref:Ankyrin repeat-containing domain protein n=1 Tax=Aspergillus lucknowensis TaxID=176173 RepID=A0ABR4LU81_9EURO
MEEFSGGKSKALQQWVRGYDLLVRCTAGKYTGSTSSLSLLFISARLNLTSLAERFVSTGSALTSLVNLPGTKALAGGASSWGMVRQQVVNLPDMKGWRALHVAADSEAEDVVVWLLENGAAVDAETMGFVRPGRTALHFAASKSTETAARIVRKLLESGANPGAPTRFGGNTPLHYAVRGGSEDILKTLLQHRSKHKPVDPNVPNYSGITALHKAAGVAGWHKPVDLLLEYGANPEQAASLDKVAVARGVKDVKVASTLKAVTSMKTATMWKSATDTFRGVATEHTALHIAIRAKGTEETIKRLLAWYTANDKMIESRDSMGYVPLHSAVEGSPTYTRLLLESKKVDVNARDNEGRTPLMLYLRRLGQPQSTASIDDLVALKGTLDDLLAAGATPDTQDNNGKSVLDYATQAGQTWAVDKLRSILPPLESPKVASTPASPQGMVGKASNLMGGKFAMFSKK